MGLYSSIRFPLVTPQDREEMTLLLLQHRHYQEQQLELGSWDWEETALEQLGLGSQEGVQEPMTWRWNSLPGEDCPSRVGISGSVGVDRRNPASRELPAWQGICSSPCGLQMPHEMKHYSPRTALPQCPSLPCFLPTHCPLPCPQPTPSHSSHSPSPAVVGAWSRINPRGKAGEPSRNGCRGQ